MCKEIKPITEFNKNKKGFLGLVHRCKECLKIVRGKTRKLQQEYNRKWNKINKEKRNKYSKEWRKSNPSYSKIYSKIYYKDNADNWRNRYKPNLLSMEEWRRRNPNYNTDYYRRNPEKSVLYRHKRAARKRSLPDDLTEEQLVIIQEYFDNSCSLTSLKEDIHFDHVIPLAIGRGGTTIGNIIPLNAKLNSSKSTSNIFVWFNSNEERLSLDKYLFDKTIKWLAYHNKMTVNEYKEYVDYCHENPVEVALYKKEDSEHDE